MKKYLTLVSLLLVLAITPVVASNNKNDQRADQENTCDVDGDYKNHGEYVSCVAKTHPGGEVVSQAARSAIGKKDDDADDDDASPTPSPAFSPSPTVSPSVEPSPTVSPSPEATASPEVTPSPEATAESTVEIQESVLQNIINKLNDLIEQISGFLS